MTRKECNRYSGRVDDNFCGNGLNLYIASKKLMNGLFVNTVNDNAVAIGTEDERIMKYTVLLFALINY